MTSEKQSNVSQKNSQVKPLCSAYKWKENQKSAKGYTKPKTCWFFFFTYLPTKIYPRIHITQKSKSLETISQQLVFQVIGITV